jgi:hypothetical protein
MNNFETWLNDNFKAVYYDSVFKFKDNGGEYSDMELKQIYESIVNHLNK